MWMTRLMWALPASASLVFVYGLASNFDHGLWYDEVFSLKVTDPTLSFEEALAIQFVDASPFTYYLIFRWWRLIFGADFYTAQSFNIAMFVFAAIAAVFIWPKRNRQECLVFLSLNATCVAVIYYLLEIRSYGLICAVALVTAACLNRLLDEPSSDQEGDVKILYAAVIGCAVLIMCLHGWGGIFGAGIVITLFLYERTYGGRKFGMIYFLLAAVVAACLLAVVYKTLVLHMSDRLGAAGINGSAGAAGDPLVLVTNMVELLYVTFRSKVLAGLALPAVLYVCVREFSKLKSALLVFVVPILFVYLIVIVAHVVADRFIQKSYFNVMFFPFLFLFLTRVAYAIRNDLLRPALIAIFILANIGSIPFLVKFPDQPYRMEIRDGTPVYTERDG